MTFPSYFLVTVILALALLSSGAIGSESIANGKSIDQEKCYTCHSKKTGFGNGDMIYTRADSKVRTLVKLNSMISTCNAQLRLDLFPEDENDIASYLNKQFYKFKP